MHASLNFKVNLKRTRPKAGGVVLNAGQVQIMIPSLQVFIYTVSLASLLCVMVTMMTPTTSAYMIIKAKNVSYYYNILI